MKRKFSTLVARISVFVLFLICCSSGIMATEAQEYRVPRHSMSYFLQQNTGQPSEDARIIVEPAPEPVEYQSTSAATREIDMSWQSHAPTHQEQTKIDNEDYSEDVDFIELAKHAEEQVESISDDAPFGETLRRMQQRSAQRRAEAAQLGITLPSQSGNIAAVSPSLNRLNQAVNDIINRA